jgi:hypothetical protein
MTINARVEIVINQNSVPNYDAIVGKFERYIQRKSADAPQEDAKRIHFELRNGIFGHYDRNQGSLCIIASGDLEKITRSRDALLDYARNMYPHESCSIRLTRL